MSPLNIIKRAKELKLDVIAITDHNSIFNSFPSKRLGEREGIKVLLGMEAQTLEEVHILTLFDNENSIEKFYSEVYAFLPELENDPEYFGDQLIVDEEENILREEKKLLANSLELSIEELTELVKKYGGYVIPSHIERDRFGLLTNLYKIPDSLKECVFEISYNASLNELFNFYPFLKNFPFISNSDAHYLSDMGRAYTQFEVSEISLNEIYSAAKEGRYKVFRR